MINVGPVTECVYPSPFMRLQFVAHVSKLYSRDTALDVRNPCSSRLWRSNRMGDDESTEKNSVIVNHSRYFLEGLFGNDAMPVLGFCSVMLRILLTSSSATSHISWRTGIWTCCSVLWHLNNWLWSQISYRATGHFWLVIFEFYRKLISSKDLRQYTIITIVCGTITISIWI